MLENKYIGKRQRQVLRCILKFRDASPRQLEENCGPWAKNWLFLQRVLVSLMEKELVILHKGLFRLAMKRGSKVRTELEQFLSWRV